MAIKFKELRRYISRVVRLSICFQNGYYDNYHLIADIPKGKYDDMYVLGIGMADVEFPMDVYAAPVDEDNFRCNSLFLGHALEIVLHDEDSGIERKDEKTLRFGDLRNYLQIGRYFSVMIKGEWKPDCYVWRQEIPEDYNDMPVYGIGIEDNPKEFKAITTYKLLDSCMSKRMSIVLEDETERKEEY